MADVNLVKSKYTGSDVTSLGELTASDNAKIPGTLQVVGATTLDTDLTVANGGTGASTLTDHGVLVGSGTDAITALAVGTNGQVLVGSTGADPVFATITDGEGIDTTLGAGKLTIACKDASTSNKGVIEIATNAETVAFSDTSRAITADDLGYVLQKSYNHVNYAKGRLLDRILANGTGLYTTLSNIKGLWIFDQTGAVSTITDRSGNGHTITLRNGNLDAINASTCTPGVSGLAPYLTFDATHQFDMVDSDDFSLTDGAGNDVAGSMLSLINLVDATSCGILYKYDNASTTREYEFYFNSGDKIGFLIHKSDGTARQGRTYNTALTSQQGTWNTFSVTYSGSELSSGIKIYQNYTQIDDTDVNAGSYAGMSNTTTLPASYENAALIASPMKAKLSVLVFIKEELSATQVANWDRLLRSYAGVSL